MIARAHSSGPTATRVAALCLMMQLISCAAIAGDVQASRAWRYSVYADKLPQVDDIAVRRDGSVYATQALAGGNGRIVRLHGGKAEIVANNLEQPRGLLVKQHSLYVTEQVDNGRVLEISLDSKKRRTVENLFNPEHLVTLHDGDVAVVENGINGRLVRLLANGAVEVITGGLNSPEGLAVGRDGTIFIGESGTGRILAFRGGAMDVVIDDLDELGQIEATADDALWITEKGSPGRLLRLKDGALETVLTGLKEPRGIAITASGAILVAEQGRGRILVVELKP